MQSLRVPILAVLVLATAACLFLTGCGGDSEAPAASIASPGQSASADTSQGPQDVQEPVQVLADGASTETPAAQLPQVNYHPEVVISTEFGDIRVRLDAEKAPLTVDNFLSNYVERGFYSGTVFHYVEKGFMIIGGGYTAELEEKETRAYLKSEADNGLKNTKGTIAMIRQPGHADSATSQFFINLDNNSALDHKDSESAENAGYCVFGEVVDGMDVAEKIAEVAVTDKDDFPKTPVESVLIKSIELIR